MGAPKTSAVVEFGPSSTIPWPEQRFRLLVESPVPGEGPALSFWASFPRAPLRPLRLAGLERQLRHVRLHRMLGAAGALVRTQLIVGIDLSFELPHEAHACFRRVSGAVCLRVKRVCAHLRSQLPLGRRKGHVSPTAPGPAREGPWLGLKGVPAESELRAILSLRCACPGYRRILTR